MTKTPPPPANKQLEVMSEPGKAVGKFITKVTAARANDSLVLTFISALPNEQAQLVERVVLDPKLARDLVRLIQTTMEIEKNEPGTDT